MTLKQRQSKLASRTRKLTIDEFYKVKNYTGEDFDEGFENGIWKMIGYCVTSFNSLEDALDFILTDVISPNEDASYLIIKSMGYSQKTSLLIDLMATDREMFKEFTLEDIKSLKFELSFIGDVRNRIVHGDWESYSVRLQRYLNFLTQKIR